jgi:hypothetical protein
MCGWLLGASAAMALTPPAGIEIDGSWLGKLTLSGGADGYAFVQSGTSQSSFNGNNVTGTRLANALISLQKTSGLIQFNMAIGANTGAIPLGTAPVQASVTTLATGPLYYGYLTIAPPGSPVTFSAGQLISLEGFEAGTDWYNSNLFTSELFYTQSSMFRGAEASYRGKNFNATIAWGDGYETGVFNTIQAVATYQLPHGQSISAYYAGPLGRVGLNAKTYAVTGHYGDPASFATVGTYGPYYANSQMFGAYYTWTNGTLSLTPEIQYQYAKADAKLVQPGWAAMSKFSSNLGVALFADYPIPNTPYEIGAMAEYFTSNGPDSWFIAPGAQGAGFAVTPSWQHKNLFIRASAGYLHLLNGSYAGDGQTGAFGNAAHGRDVVQGLLEAGILF